jgi:hypothetical protein
MKTTQKAKKQFIVGKKYFMPDHHQAQSEYVAAPNTMCVIIHGVKILSTERRYNMACCTMKKCTKMKSKKAPAKRKTAKKKK